MSIICCLGGGETRHGHDFRSGRHQRLRLLLQSAGARNQFRRDGIQQRCVDQRSAIRPGAAPSTGAHERLESEAHAQQTVTNNKSMGYVYFIFKFENLSYLGFFLNKMILADILFNYFCSDILWFACWILKEIIILQNLF